MTKTAARKREEEDRLIGTEELATLLNVHVVTIYRHLVKRSDFPKPIKIGTRLAWWRSEIVAYAESKRVA
jgi:predicted DNA-binding transcriptional regulator AlpA